MKRILFYRPTLYCGGAEKVIVNKANYYANEGHDVSIILKSDRIDFNIDDKVKIILIRTPKMGVIKKILSFLERGLGYYYYLFSSLFISIQVKAIIFIDERKNGVFDFFFVHSNKSYMDLLYLNHPNKIIICHSNKSSLYSSSKYKYKQQIAKRLAEFIFRRTKKIVCVSNGIKKDLVDNFFIDDKKISVIYNPFDIDSILHDGLISNDIKDKYIVHVGRLSEEKRHNDLLEIYNKSLFFNTHKLIIIGDGFKKSEILNKIKNLKLEDKVLMLGFQSNPYKYIKNADALILCSEYEGFGNVLVEAGILNTNAISSNCNYGPSELLLNDYLFPVGNINMGVLVLNKLYTSKVNKTLAVDVQIFSLNSICNEYLDI